MKISNVHVIGEGFGIGLQLGKYLAFGVAGLALIADITY